MKAGTKVVFNCEPKVEGVIVSQEEMAKHKFVGGDDICIEWESGEKSTYDKELFEDGTIFLLWHKEQKCRSLRKNYRA